MAKWTLKALSVISGLAVASLTAAMDIDLGFVERGYSVVFDNLNRPILVGVSETPSPRIFASAYRQNGANLWTTTVTPLDPDGAEPLRPAVRLGKLYIPWFGGHLPDTLNAGTVEINASSGSVNSQSMSTSASPQFYTDSAVSANGTVYQTGNYYLAGPPATFNPVLYKKSPTGAGTFTNYPNSAGLSSTFDYVCTVPGAVYVVGHVQDFTSGSNVYMFVKKVDPTTMAVLWTTEIYGPNNYSFPVGIRTDSAGNIFVAGTQTSIFGDDDLLYAKLDSSGNILAQNAFVNPNSDEYATCFTLTASGLPAIGGSIEGEFCVSAASNDLSTINLNISPNISRTVCITTDGTNFFAAAGGYVIKVDPLCQVFWARTHPALGSTYDLSVNGSSLYTAGESGGNAKLCKIDAATGNFVW